MPYQKTIEKIYKIKHNTDDIKVAMERELVLGCVMSMNNSERIFIGKQEDEDEYYFSTEEDVNGEIDIYFCEDTENIKILGTPILLDDVLRAVNLCNGYRFFVVKDYIYISNMFEEEIKINWHLGKSFTEQPTETKDYIASLIN